MEVFEIMYKGQKIKAAKDHKSKFCVILPKRTNINGIPLQETISTVLTTNGSKAWLFSSKKEDDSGEFLKVWLYSDQTMAHETHSTGGPVFSETKFNISRNDGNFVNEICKDMYGVIRQCIEYDIFGYPSSAIGKLRRKNFEMSLNLLGYSNSSQVKKRLEDASGYMALNRIGTQLENYANLAPYIYSKGKSGDSEKFGCKVPKGIGKQGFQARVQATVQQLANNLEFLNSRDEQNERMRDILPSFCLNMKQQIDPADWDTYSSVLQQIAQLYLELNVDLIPYTDRMGVTNSTTAEGDELKAKIDKVIKSKDFSKACEIERNFVRQQVEKLKEKIDQGFEESPQMATSTIGRLLLDMKDEADRMYSDINANSEPKIRLKTEGMTQVD